MNVYNVLGIWKLLGTLQKCKFVVETQRKMQKTCICTPQKQPNLHYNFYNIQVLTTTNLKFRKLDPFGRAFHLTRLTPVIFIKLSLHRIPQK